MRPKGIYLKIIQKYSRKKYYKTRLIKKLFSPNGDVNEFYSFSKILIESSKFMNVEDSKNF